MGNKFKVGDHVLVNYFVDDEEPLHPCHGKIGRVIYEPSRAVGPEGLCLYGIEFHRLGTWNFSDKWLTKVE